MSARMNKSLYETELKRLQAELVEMQAWVRESGARIVVVFEGRDAAGKGSTIKRVTEYLNPRIARIVALPSPTERERTQWYFQRYVPHLPAAGEIVLMDRSWYNRAGVEHVMGYCTNAEYHRFLHQAPIFERMLVEDGIILLKYWFSVSDTEQEKRFRSRAEDPMRHWKLSPNDVASITQVGGLLPGQGRDVRAHRHPGGAVVRGGVRRQAPRAGQHDLAPARQGAVGADRARPDHGAPTAGVQGVRAAAAQRVDPGARPLARGRGRRRRPRVLTPGPP